MFLALSAAFCIAIILATVTTVRHINHRAEAAVVKSS
jgi:hypothetical protein